MEVKDTPLCPDLTEPLPGFVELAQEIRGLPSSADEEVKTPLVSDLPKFTRSEVEKLLLNPSVCFLFLLFFNPNFKSTLFPDFLLQVLLWNEVKVTQTYVQLLLGLLKHTNFLQHFELQ